jgi:hypothetical protein
LYARKQFSRLRPLKELIAGLEGRERGSLGNAETQKAETLK